MKKTITIFCLLLSGFYSFSQQSYIDSLKIDLASAKEDSNKVKTLNEVCLAYAWSTPDTGMAYAKESITLSKKLKYEYGEAWANGVMGYCLTTLGNYPLALDYLFKALAYFEKMNYKSGIMDSYAGLSLAYRDLGEYQQSLFYCKKALSFVDSGVVDHNLLGTLASIYAKNNQPDSAIYYALKALRIAPDWSGILFVLGDSYYKLNHLDSANYYFDRGIDGAKVNRSEIDFVDLYHGKAQVYNSKGQLDSAILYARKAMLEPFGKFYPIGVLNAITTVSNLYESKHQPDSTLKYLRAAIRLRDSLFNREKTMAIQNLAFKEQEKQKDLEASQLKYKNKIRLNALSGGVFTLLVIAFLLFRNNKQKQRSFNLLQDQKQQIDHQNSELEYTLSHLKSTQAQLIQSEKMASLGELTAGIAHEIQNPLNFVNNFSDVSAELIGEMNTEIEKGNLQEAKLIAQDLKQNLEKINHHGKRAGNIVKGTLQHSRSSSGVKEPTNINTLADEYLRLSYHGLRAKDKHFNATMKTDFDESIGNINIIPQDIGKVILNLINNAFYVVNEKSKQGLANYEPTVEVNTKKEGNKVLVSVKDNGNGIPEKVLDKIFQPFFTTKPTGQGTGLGLSLSYDIVKAHGGEFKVETKEGEGSEFIIKLPIA